MTAKVVEALAKILEGLNNNFSLEEVNTKLTQEREFDDQTVSAAYGLVYDKLLTTRIRNKKQKEDSTKNIRVLTDEEKEVLGVDNYNYVLRLFNVGLLNAADFEMLLEQLSMYPEETITKDDINWLILVSLLDFNADILPGNRILLYSSDKIN